MITERWLKKAERKRDAIIQRERKDLNAYNKVFKLREAISWVWTQHKWRKQCQCPIWYLAPLRLLTSVPVSPCYVLTAKGCKDRSLQHRKFCSFLVLFRFLWAQRLQQGGLSSWDRLGRGCWPQPVTQHKLSSMGGTRSGKFNNLLCRFDCAG